MKKQFAVISAVALAAVLAQAQGQAPAKPAAASASAATPAPTGTAAGFPTKIGLINVRDAIMQTADGKKAALDLEDKFAPRKTALQKRQIDLQAKQDQLQRGANTLSDTAKANLSREIENEQKNFKRDVEDFQSDGDEAQNKLMQEIYAKMQPVIQKYATENGFAAVLDVGSEQSPVLWASNTVFITDDVVSLYNQAHPPQPGAPAAKPAQATPAAAPKAPAPAPAKKQ